MATLYMPDDIPVEEISHWVHRYSRRGDQVIFPMQKNYTVHYSIWLPQMRKYDGRGCIFTMGEQFHGNCLCFYAPPERGWFHRLIVKCMILTHLWRGEIRNFVVKGNGSGTALSLIDPSCPRLSDL